MLLSIPCVCEWVIPSTDRDAPLISIDINRPTTYLTLLLMTNTYSRSRFYRSRMGACLEAHDTKFQAQLISPDSREARDRHIDCCALTRHTFFDHLWSVKCANFLTVMITSNFCTFLNQLGGSFLLDPSFNNIVLALPVLQLRLSTVSRRAATVP